METSFELFFETDTSDTGFGENSASKTKFRPLDTVAAAYPDSNKELTGREREREREEKKE